MKQTTKFATLASAVILLGGCAAGQKMGWGRSHPVANEVQVASCDAATATLTGRPDHDVAHRACVAAKARQGVD